MPNKPPFSGGEFTPAMYGEVDLRKYNQGLRTSKNFLKKVSPVPRWKRVMKYVLGGLAAGLIGMIIVMAMMEAMIREDRFRDKLREDRCADFGEAMTKEQAKQCEGIGQ